MVHATNTTASNGQQVALTSLFSASGSGITQYRVWYGWPEGGSPALGSVTNNGSAIAQDQWVNVSSLGGLQYTGGATAGTDNLGRSLQRPMERRGDSQHHRPGRAAGGARDEHDGEQWPTGGAQSFFSASGNGITQYRVWFGWPEGGSPALGTVTNNGTAIAQDQWVNVSSLSGLQYTGGATAGTDKIWVEAYNGQWSGVGIVSITDQGGGLAIKLVADQSVINQFGSNYQSSVFWQDVQAAATILDNTVADHISVTINVGWGTVDNQGDSTLQPGGDNTGGAAGNAVLGSDNSYSELKGHLAGTLPLVGTTQIAGTTQTIDGTTPIFLASAQQKALNISGSLFEQAQALLGTPDGAIGFGTSSQSIYWEEMALHELTHALGRTTKTYADAATEFDLYRYDASGDGQLQWTGSSPAYLSINGGLSALSVGGEQAQFSTVSDYGDLDGNLVYAPNDPFDASAPSPPVNSLTALDKEILTVMGFNVTHGSGILSTASTTAGSTSGALIMESTGNVSAASLVYQSSAGGAVGLQAPATLTASTQNDLASGATLGMHLTATDAGGSQLVQYTSLGASTGTQLDQQGVLVLSRTT